MRKSQLHIPNPQSFSLLKCGLSFLFKFNLKILIKNYSLEMINKNITQNNIEKIKSSIKRLKDTINRSNSNNYRNYFFITLLKINI